MVKTNGEVAICRRTPSGTMTDGGGYVHFLTDAPPRRVPPPPLKRPTPAPVKDWAYYQTQAANALKPALATILAQSLRLPIEAVLRLAPGWDAHQNAYTFPMRSALGQITGIRLRSILGEKRAVVGSRQGLFYDMTLTKADEIVVCEGPTDAAALYALDLIAVGRPSCQGCEEDVARLARKLRASRVSIIADEDCLKKPIVGASGSQTPPGLRGARVLQATLSKRGILSRIVMPPFGFKDIRAWVAGGATLKDWKNLTADVTFR